MDLDELVKVTDPYKIKYLIERKKGDRTIKYVMYEVKSYSDDKVRKNERRRKHITYYFDDRDPVSTTYRKYDRSKLWGQEYLYNLPNGYYLLFDSPEKMIKVIQDDMQKTIKDMERLSRLEGKLDYYNETYKKKFPEFFV
jgi:hypothetical protein